MQAERQTPILSIWFLTTLIWWALAFLPTPGASPEWLVTTRNVCFGTMGNGLPAPSGWMILILGPLSFLAAFMVVWPHEVGAILAQARRSTTGKVVLGLALTITLIETTWVAQKIIAGRKIAAFDFNNPDRSALPEEYPQAHLPVADFTLIDQFGKQVTLSNLKGRTTVVTFAYAHCQTVCPILVRHAIDAIKPMNPDTVKLLIITLDPWRDTPKALPYLAEEWQLPPQARVLSGDVDTVLRVIKDFNVPATRDEKTGDVSHPSLTYVLSPSGMIEYTFNNAPASWLEQAIQRIENDKNITSARRAF